MPADRATLAALVEEIGRFYVRDRALLRAQADMERAIADGATPSDRQAERYLAAVRAYFTGFEREARAHLADIDHRLAKVSQLQFNLTAERGVTARRVDVTGSVLARAAELARG